MIIVFLYRAVPVEKMAVGNDHKQSKGTQKFCVTTFMLAEGPNLHKTITNHTKMND